MKPIVVFCTIRGFKEFEKIILDILKLNKNELETMGKRGRNWILKHRKYSKLADEYLKIFNNG